MDVEKIKEDIIENLKEVYDPEIPINVYDLGLIYEINVKKTGDVHLVMSLTSPTCPTADYLKSVIEEAAATTPGVKSVDVELTFEPKWTPDRVSIEAKEELGLVDTKMPEHLAVENVFNNDNLTNKNKTKESQKLNLCFNCGVSEDKKPLLQAKYKNEEVLICTTCTLKF